MHFVMTDKCLCKPTSRTVTAELRPMQGQGLHRQMHAVPSPSLAITSFKLWVEHALRIMYLHHSPAGSQLAAA